MTNIYVLELHNNKYYIGKTNNIEKRFEQHINGNGSLWTKLHKPIKIIEIYYNCDSFDEDKYVKYYMSKYGIDNVRGGVYIQKNLDNNTIKLLEREIRGSNDLCLNCGSNSHFINNCSSKYNDESDEDNSMDEDEEDEYYEDEYDDEDDEEEYDEEDDDGEEDEESEGDE